MVGMNFVNEIQAEQTRLQEALSQIQAQQAEVRARMETPAQIVNEIEQPKPEVRCDANYQVGRDGRCYDRYPYGYRPWG